MKKTTHSAKTGKFVSKEFAKENPETTVEVRNKEQPKPMNDKTKVFIDLSKLSEEQIKELKQLTSYKIGYIKAYPYFQVIREGWNQTDHTFLEGKTEPTYTLTAEQLKEIAEDGAKVKEMFPEVFDTKLEIGKWYKGSVDFHSLICITEIHNRGTYERVHYFGWLLGVYSNQDYFVNTDHQNSLVPATDEEVTAALEKECVKRYGEDWKNARIKKSLTFKTIQCLNLGNLDADIIIEDNKIWNHNGCIFYHGKWAEPLSETTTVSLDKAKEILAKKYNTTPDKITIENK